MRRVLFGVIGIVVLIALIAWKTCGDSDSSKGSATTKAGSAQSGGVSVGRTSKRGGPVTPASLSGRVTRASDGAGIAGAVVSLAPAELMAMFFSSDSPTLVVVTDANGAWKAPIVPPGAYVVAATARGFLPGSKEKLVVGSAEQKSGIDLVLTAGGTIVSGTVTDVGGGPIADARVTATIDRDMPELWGRADLVTVTGADGRYELTLAEGEYSIEAKHDDYTNDREHADVLGSPLTIDFTLVPGAIIRGQVVARDSGEPVPGAIVRAEADRGGDATALADGDGNFTLRSLDAGAIGLDAMGRGYASTTSTIVPVGIGEQVDGVRILVDRAYSISGRVVRKGKPDQGLPGVTLGAFSIAAKAFGLAIEPSADDGSFEIIGVRPAAYMLFAVGEGSVPDIGKNVEVVDKDIEGVVVEMPAGVTVSGRVEPPVAGARISIMLAGEIGLANMMEMAKSFLVRAETDATGAFTLKNVPIGAFTLNANAPDGQAGELPLVVAEVDQSGLVVKLESRASVSGRVVDTSGKPASGIRVSSTRLDPTDKPQISFGPRGGNAGVTTAADGSFKLVGLEAGKYRVHAIMDDDPFAGLDKKAAPSKASVELELTATTVKTGVTLTVDARDGVIRGTVLMPDKKPAADAWVTARRINEPPAGVPAEVADQMRGVRAGPPVLTNADGQFTIGKLRRGTYTLEVEGPKGATHAEKPGVKTGDNVTIQLLSRGTLSGKVTAGGAPVEKYEISCDSKSGDAEKRIDAKDGAYTLERLAPGPYTCTIDSDIGTSTAKVEVPAGPITQDFTLTRWATVTGTIVSVLDKRPLANLNVFAGPSDGNAFSSRNVEGLLTGTAPKSDASGRFTVPRVAPGKGKVAVMPKEGFMPLGTRDYTVTEGQTFDIGAIEIVPPREGDAGTYGLSTAIDGDKLVVASVKDAGPAAASGVQVGDRITSINGRDVSAITPPIAQTLLQSGTIGVGQTAQLAIDRGGSPVNVTLVSVKW